MIRMANNNGSTSQTHELAHKLMALEKKQQTESLYNTLKGISMVLSSNNTCNENLINGLPDAVTKFTEYRKPKAQNGYYDFVETISKDIDALYYCSLKTPQSIKLQCRMASCTANMENHKFRSYYELAVHMNSHSRACDFQPSVVCDPGCHEFAASCPFRYLGFKDENEKKEHKQLRHCPKCQRIFSRIDNLRTHETGKDGKMSPCERKLQARNSKKRSRSRARARGSKVFHGCDELSPNMYYPSEPTFINEFANAAPLEPQMSKPSQIQPTYEQALGLSYSFELLTNNIERDWERRISTMSGTTSDSFGSQQQSFGVPDFANSQTSPYNPTNDWFPQELPNTAPDYSDMLLNLSQPSLFSQIVSGVDNLTHLNFMNDNNMESPESVSETYQHNTYDTQMPDNPGTSNRNVKSEDEETVFTSVEIGNPNEFFWNQL